MTPGLFFCYSLDKIAIAVPFTDKSSKDEDFPSVSQGLIKSEVIC